MAVSHRFATTPGCIAALRAPALRQSLYDAAAVLMDRVVVNLHGEEHRARREAEARVFRKDVFLAYEKSVLPATLAQTIAPFVAAGGGDLVEIGYRVMMNLTVDFTGIDRIERSAAETGVLLELMRTFSLAPALGQSRLEDVEPLRQRIADAMTVFDTRFFAPSLARREALLAAGAALPSDVLSALVAARARLGLSRDELLKESIFFVLAGAHTSIHSLTHAAAELFRWLPEHPEDRHRLADDPFFVQACVFESLRLHPSSPVAKRRALCAAVIDNTAVAAGDEVIVDLHVANREPNRFGSAADRFDPHRVVPGDTFPYGLSMGHGAHACLGRNLAVGVVPKADADPETHQFGTVPLILRALLDAGMRPDPDRPPARDETSTRISWTHFPVVFQ